MATITSAQLINLGPASSVVTGVTLDAVPYALVSTTPSALVDRACNNLGTQSASFALTLPAATSGFARDFLFRLYAGGAISITFPTAGGVTYWGDSGAFGALTSGKWYEFSLTEIAENAFLVGRKELAELTQA